MGTQTPAERELADDDQVAVFQHRLFDLLAVDVDARAAAQVADVSQVSRLNEQGVRAADRAGLQANAAAIL